MGNKLFLRAHVLMAEFGAQTGWRGTAFRLHNMKTAILAGADDKEVLRKLNNAQRLGKGAYVLQGVGLFSAIISVARLTKTVSTEEEKWRTGLQAAGAALAFGQFLPMTKLTNWNTAAQASMEWVSAGSFSFGGSQYGFEAFDERMSSFKLNTNLDIRFRTEAFDIRRLYRGDSRSGSLAGDAAKETTSACIAMDEVASKQGPTPHTYTARRRPTEVVMRQQTEYAPQELQLSKKTPYGVMMFTAVGLLLLSAVQIGLAALSMHMAWQDWRRHMAACEGSEQGYCSETNLGLMAAEFYTELAMLVYVSGAIVVDIFRFVSIQAFGGQLPFGSAQGRLAAIGAKFLQFGGGSSLVKAGQILKGVFAFVGAAGFVISLINEIYKAKREQDFGELVRPDLMQQSGLF